MSSFIRKKHQQLEQSVLKEAYAVLTISQTFQKDLEILAHRKIRLLTNGYDPADIPLDFSPKKKEAGKLHLVYSGIIDAIRNPIPLMDAIKSEFQKSGEQIEWTFVGKVSEKVQNYVKADSWLNTRIHFAGYVSHQEVFGFYEKADALVLILTETKNAQGNIPGKLFEYLATGIPVLALGDPNGDSAQILKDSGGGEVIAHSDSEGIKKRLRSLLDSNSNETKSADLEKYSRRNLSFQLAQILDEHTLS